MEINMEKIIKRILFVFFLFFVSLSVGAQSKPKRDVTKDRMSDISVSKIRKNKKADNKVAVNSPRKNTRNSSIRHKKRSSNSLNRKPSLASFLYVNGLNTVSTTIDYLNSKVEYSVRTDGQNWKVTNLPSWCSYVKSSSNSFVLYSLENSEFEARNSYFDIESDNQCVRVNITQLAAPLNVKNIDATISNMYLRHNTASCLIVNATISVQNAKGIELLPIAFIYYDLNNVVKASEDWSSYAMTGSGGVHVVGKTIKPIVNSRQTFFVSMVLPNNAMQLRKKKNKLRCYLFLYCPKTNSYLGRTATVYFKAKVKRGKVKTSPY